MHATHLSGPVCLFHSGEIFELLDARLGPSLALVHGEVRATGFLPTGPFSLSAEHLRRTVGVEPSHDMRLKAPLSIL
jgi:hypothetical protein